MSTKVAGSAALLLMAVLQPSCGTNPWTPTESRPSEARTQDSQRFELHDLRSGSVVTTMLLDRKTGRVWEYVGSTGAEKHGQTKDQYDLSDLGARRADAEQPGGSKGQFIQIPVQGLVDEDSQDPLGILQPNATSQRVPKPQSVQTQSKLPPRALAQLKEGQITTFRNGQEWTLRNGNPVQLDPKTGQVIQ